MEFNLNRRSLSSSLDQAINVDVMEGDSMSYRLLERVRQRITALR